MARTDLHLILERMVNDFDPVIREAFLTLIQDLKNDVILRDLINAIENAEFERAFQMLGLDAAAMRPVTAAINSAYEAGGMAVAASFPARLRAVTGARFRFDVRSVRAESWLREESSRLVVEITDEARQIVRQHLETGMANGQNPKQVALDLIGRMDRQSGQRVGGVIGLTGQQTRWVQNTRAMLENLDANYFKRKLRPEQFDNIVIDAIAKKKPLDYATIDRLVTAYEANALRYRGQVIGRTEAIRALNMAQHESLKQAVENGAFPASAVERIWDATGDARTRPSHMIMEGQRVGLDEPFTFPGLLPTYAMFPADDSLGAPAEEITQCRCRVRIDIDYFAGVT